MQTPCQFLNWLNQDKLGGVLQECVKGAAHLCEGRCTLVWNTLQNGLKDAAQGCEVPCTLCEVPCTLCGKDPFYRRSAPSHQYTEFGRAYRFKGLSIW